MKLVDRFLIGVRHIRTRLVESILVIAATAVGVALLSAMLAFVRAYDQQTAALVNNPAYREVLVEVVGNETELDVPVRPFDAETTSEIALGADDIDRAMMNTSSVRYGYLADFQTLSTRAAGGFRFAARAAGARDTADARPDGAAPEATPPDSGSPTGDNSAQGGTPAPGGFAGRGRFGPGSAAAPDGAQTFDFESLLAADEDVLTELPLESFGGLRATVGLFEAYGLVAAEGSIFTREDVEEGNGVLVLGSELARTLFPEGDAVGTRVRLNFQTYTIVGVLEPSGLSHPASGVELDELAYIPNSNAQLSFGGTTFRLSRPTRTLRFAVSDSQDVEVAIAELETHFATEFGTGAVEVSAPIAALRAERERQSRVLTVVLFLAAAALFIASINLFNLMLLRVVKRTKSVGISRAIGASRGDVFSGFLTESATMSGAGALLGLAAAPTVYGMLRDTLTTGTVATAAGEWPLFIAGAAVAFAISVLFGVWPARQASRIDASLAIRTE